MTPSSPCVQVCIMDPRSGVCRGCCRTLEEIAAWAAMREPERLRIMALLPARKRALDTEEGSDGRNTPRLPAA
jgi:predicted Fe-S protein YdhL (DUF1289 family)